MKKVVIIGGGFAGSCLAKSLEKSFDVLLIDDKDYFEFTPGVLRTIVEPEHMSKIQLLHASYLRKAKLVRGCVTEAEKGYVKIKNKKYGFDYLAICSGSGYNLPIKEREVVVTARAKTLRDCYRKLYEASTVLIIGGGLVGVELAGEIIWKYPDKKVIICHSREKILQRNNEKTIKYGMNFLKKNKVDIILNERVVKKKKGAYITNKGTKLKADMAFLCTGIKPNFEFMKKCFSKALNKINQIKVNSYLQVIGCNNIFAAGDVNDTPVEKTAQNAQAQAKTVAKNIKNLEKGKKLVKYKSEQTPMVISLGKYDGIFTRRNFAFGGIIPAFMKAVIEKVEMWRRKV